MESPKRSYIDLDTFSRRYPATFTAAQIALFVVIGFCLMFVLSL